MKNPLFIIFLLTLVVSCSSIKPPGFISPDRSSSPSVKGYGNYPDNYQSIIKGYLISKLSSYKDTKVEFINMPNKLSIDHLGSTFTGYRLCLSLNEKESGFYKGYRNHIFLINNGEITLHLFDSGLLKIPFEYCVTRDESKTLFVQDIPNEKTNIDKTGVTIDSMDKVKIKDKNTNNIYIVCKFDSSESTYVFNENDTHFNQYDDMKMISYDVSFNEAFINAKNEYTELVINRISGDVTNTKNDGSTFLGNCNIFDRKRF